MKNYLSILITIVIFAGLSCQQNADVEKEKEAVLKVLQEEGDEFAAFNKERVYEIHIQDETAIRVAESTVLTGWDEIKALYENYFSYWQADTITNLRNLKENVVAKVNGNSAWVVCDNIWKWEANGQPGGIQNKQIAVLDKQDGKWKIALNAFVEQKQPEIIGAWNLVSTKSIENGETWVDIPKKNPGDAIKIWSSSHYSATGKAVLNNEEINYHSGGTYTLVGNKYTENVKYHHYQEYRNESINMTIEIKNDTLVQTYPVDADGNFDKNNYTVEKYVRLD